MYWNYGFGWGFPFFPLFWILFWVFIVMFLFRRGSRWHHWHDHDHEEKSAKDILDERFANGEINEEEYEKRLTILKKHEK